MIPHIPVLLDTVLALFREEFAARADLLFVDATLGAAGHTVALLEAFPGSRVVAFDQDAQARRIAEERAGDYATRLRVVPENFRSLGGLCDEAGWPGADGVLFDLGVSNMQLTTPERGFSYQEDGPLDMRMDNERGATTAYDLLCDADLRELARIFREYGEERHAYAIAKAIVRSRERGELPDSTEGLTALIRRTLPAPVQRKMGTHPARRVFQALRIAVNAEIDVLAEGVEGALRIVAPGGLIAVISYHSLEDRLIKRRFLKWAEEGGGKIVTRKPMVPDAEEIERNRSARSAKLRVFQRQGEEKEFFRGVCQG